MSPASDRQVELGEAQRAVILAELRTAGATSPRDLCDRLGLHSGTVQRHLARFLRAGVVHVARGVTSTGRRTAYALTQEAADAAIAATAPPRAHAPAVVIPPPPPSQPREVARMLPMYEEARGHADRTEANRVALAHGVERRHTCDRYDVCLDHVPHAAVDARCPRECPGYELSESETREARLLVATARTAFDTDSLLPCTRGLALGRDGR